MILLLRLHPCTLLLFSFGFLLEWGEFDIEEFGIVVVLLLDGLLRKFEGNVEVRSDDGCEPGHIPLLAFVGEVEQILL